MTNKIDLVPKPNLAEPGAGIGHLEMLFLKFYLKPFVVRHLSLSKSLLNLDQGSRQITEQIKVFNSDDLTRRILVKRPYFVEDSSRHWSVAMLCNHLGKVNGALAKALEHGFTAKAGLDYSPKDRLKAVKPELEKNVVEEIEEFLRSVERIQAAVQGKSEVDLGSRLIPHPWFGDLTHVQWIWFAGFHMKIHARQLRQMQAELSKPER